MALFGASSPFGASTPSPFGGASSSSNPFGATTSNPFGTSQNTTLFGAKPFGSPTFGGQTGSSLFGGTATGVFGQTQASPLGSSTPAFGSSSTPAFGSTPSPFGSGTSIFGQKPATPFGGFGSPTGQANPFGSTPFGQSQAAFGSQPFGSTTPAFGSTTAAFGSSAPAFGSTPSLAFGSSTPGFGNSSSPAFGASSAPAFGASSAPAFGTSSTSAFGASSTPAFGTPSTSLFGGSTPVFGQSTSAFGSSSAPTFGSSSVFGSGATNPFGAQSTSAFGTSSSPAFGSSSFATSPFTGQRSGSRAVPYAVTNDAEAGVSGQAGKLMSISAMPAYKHKSPDELRWEDYQAGDKGGPGTTGQQSSAGMFGSASSSNPFGTGNSGTLTQASSPNPFGGGSSSIFGKPAAPFGTPGTASGFGVTSSPFGVSSTGSAFGQGTTSSFGVGISSPFGGGSSPGFGSVFGSSSSTFGSPATAFSSGPAFSSPSLFNSGTSSFGSNPFAQNQTSGALFSTPNPSFGSPNPGFGIGSNPSFSSNPFGSNSPFQAARPSTGLSRTGGSAPGQTSGSFGFAGLGQQQPAANPFGAPSIGGVGVNTLTQQPIASVPVSNPFGTLPAMPQMSIGRSAGTSPSIQYGIASIPVSDKPIQERTNSLLTPRHISQRSRIRMQARRYHPKKDSPKVSFFNETEETPSTPKADALFVPRENPRALFIRQHDRLSSSPLSTSMNARELARPSQQDGVAIKENGKADGSSLPDPDLDSPLQSWSGLAYGEGNIPTSPPQPHSERETPFSKDSPKQNGSHAEHNHRGNGYISITGHRAGEAAVAYEHGADIEVLMPKLRHSDYYIQPRVQELAAKERAEPGYCRRVKDFVVGRNGYGLVKFLDETDVRGLDLESIIQFNRCEVLVYMDESKKPPPGMGLNKPAEITLFNVKCLDKKTGKHYSEGVEVEKFEKKLKKKTEDQDAEFISYSATKMEWKFRVKHFSRYCLVDSDTENSLFVDIVVTAE